MLKISKHMQALTLLLQHMPSNPMDSMVLKQLGMLPSAHNRQETKLVFPDAPILRMKF